MLFVMPMRSATSAIERAALGYLHGNCSSCHNARGPLASLDFSLEVRLAGGAATPAALASAVERTARFQPSGAPPMARLAPGHPEASLLLQRMSRRDPIFAMPPLGSQVVDRQAVVLVERHWVKGGETRVFDAQGPSGCRFVMAEAWSALLLDDQRVVHETTPIQPDGGAGWRDTLVLTFRADGFQNPVI